MLTISHVFAEKLIVGTWPCVMSFPPGLIEHWKAPKEGRVVLNTVSKTSLIVRHKREVSDQDSDSRSVEKIVNHHCVRIQQFQIIVIAAHLLFSQPAKLFSPVETLRTYE